MVVGHGMIAKAFSRYAADDRVVLFASGVANSRTTDTREFEREQELLGRTIALCRDKLLVYISTCSVDDKDVAQSPYVMHKLNMEALIAHSVGTYLILRLPQVVGKSSNPHTLVNYLHDCIVRGKRFAVWRNAVRYLIDVEDVVQITSHLVDHTTVRNAAINIVSRPYAIPDIVAVLERITGCRADCEFEDRGANYHIDGALSSQIAARLNITFDELYLESMLAKYYAKPA